MFLLIVAASLGIAGAGGSRTYKGCFHIHSAYSDGGGTLEEIMVAARESDLDFVVVTDHNTLKPLQEGKEGWYENSLLLIGAELSLDAGHFIVLDVPPDFEWDRHDAQGTIDRVNAVGGFGIVAHPDSQTSWKNWDVTGYKGMELTNLCSLFHQQSKDRPQRLLLDFARGYFKDTKRAMKRVMSVASDGSLERWSRMLHDQRPVGIGGTDAHGVVDLKVGKLHIPSYADIFKSLQLQIVVREEFDGDFQHDKALVYDAIRQGRCCTTYSIWGDPTGFEFTAKRGKTEVVMGESISKSGLPVTLRAKIPGADTTDCRVYRYDKLILSTHRTKVLITAGKPGAYRLEVDRHKGGRTIPWIISNPIYVDP